MIQLELFPDIELRLTPAMAAGDSWVTQCAQCGVLVCVPSFGPKNLGACPACAGCTWWHQRPGNNVHQLLLHIAGPFWRRHPKPWPVRIRKRSPKRCAYGVGPGASLIVGDSCFRPVTHRAAWRNADGTTGHLDLCRHHVDYYAAPWAYRAVHQDIGTEVWVEVLTRG
jgi:hypothetical protein